MARLDLESDVGALHVFGWQRDVMSAAAELALARLRAGACGVERVALAGKDARFDGRALPFGASVRLMLTRARAPLVASYYNLSWLTERLIAAPLPLAAGVIVRAGRPRFEFLLTRCVPGARILRDFLRDSEALERDLIMSELAREVARMHALAFEHGDLTTDNVLIAPREELQRCLFLDTARGGPRHWSAAAERDIARLFASAGRTLDADARERFLARYAAGRAAQGRPIDLDLLARRVHALSRRDVSA